MRVLRHVNCIHTNANGRFMSLCVYSRRLSTPFRRVFCTPAERLGRVYLVGCADAESRACSRRYEVSHAARSAERVIEYVVKRDTTTRSR